MSFLSACFLALLLALSVHHKRAAAFAFAPRPLSHVRQLSTSTNTRLAFLPPLYSTPSEEDAEAADEEGKDLEKEKELCRQQ